MKNKLTLTQKKFLYFILYKENNLPLKGLLANIIRETLSSDEYTNSEAIKLNELRNKYKKEYKNLYGEWMKQV